MPCAEVVARQGKVVGGIKDGELFLKGEFDTPVEQFEFYAVILLYLFHIDKNDAVKHVEVVSFGHREGLCVV